MTALTDPRKMRPPPLSVIVAVIMHTGRKSDLFFRCGKEQMYTMRELFYSYGKGGKLYRSIQGKCYISALFFDSAEQRDKIQQHGTWNLSVMRMHGVPDHIMCTYVQWTE